MLKVYFREKGRGREEKGGSDRELERRKLGGGWPTLRSISFNTLKQTPA